MKNSFEEYLGKIGITTVPIKERIDKFINLFTQICNEEMSDIFIDDIVTTNGERKYTGLTCFSKNYTICADNFLEEEKIIFGKVDEPIIHLTFNTNEYDFKKATKESRLNINLEFRQGAMYGDYKASNANCNFLRDIHFKYLLPRIIK